uniref:Uncharacterized protein n=1 Tax=Arundo donax TaxID=35708 RepID=A0A0A9TF12_ARUDO
MTTTELHFKGLNKHLRPEHGCFSCSIDIGGMHRCYSCSIGVGGMLASVLYFASILEFHYPEFF